MKSKKKLIYKLQQNIQQNPFKYGKEINMRNAGVQSYDFNKLRSIRALSLNNNNIKQQQFSQKLPKFAPHPIISKIKAPYLVHQSDSKNEHNPQTSIQRQKLKIYSEHQEFQIYKTLMDQNRLKSKDLRSEIQQFSHQLDMQKYNNLPFKNSNSQHLSQKIKKHSKQLSLPQIQKNHEEAYSKYISSIKNIQSQQLSEQQKARQQVLQRIKIEEQRFNKKILKQIKLKSLKNLQKLTRSQSQVIKIDKWKQKYPNHNHKIVTNHNKNIESHQQTLIKQKKTKVILPEIQQFKHNQNSKYQSQTTKKNLSQHHKNIDQIISPVSAQIKPTQNLQGFFYSFYKNPLTAQKNNDSQSFKQINQKIQEFKLSNNSKDYQNEFNSYWNHEHTNQQMHNINTRQYLNYTELKGVQKKRPYQQNSQAKKQIQKIANYEQQINQHYWSTPLYRQHLQNHKASQFNEKHKHYQRYNQQKSRQQQYFSNVAIQYSISPLKLNISKLTRYQQKNNHNYNLKKNKIKESILRKKQNKQSDSNKNDNKHPHFNSQNFNNGQQTIKQANQNEKYPVLNSDSNSQLKSLKQKLSIYKTNKQKEDLLNKIVQGPGQMVEWESQHKFRDQEDHDFGDFVRMNTYDN